MGGDGGTKASNRRYMRGAGTADHTADSKRARAAEIAEAERDRLRQAMTTCAATGTGITFRPAGVGGSVAGGAVDIVACPYGRLYGREAAVEALLRRRERRDRGEEAEVGWHVRGLKDLHPVRFHVTKTKGGCGTVGASGEDMGDGAVRYVPSCPITGVELTGTVPAFLIVREDEKKPKRAGLSSVDDDRERDVIPNVLSERALREMGIEALQAEYGPFREDDMIRLAPPMAGGVFDEIRGNLERKREDEKLSKKAKKGEKKRKNREDGSGKDIARRSTGQPDALPPSTPAGKKRKHNDGHVGTAAAARSTVAEAVASNPVFSSLFSSGRPKISDKEKRDNLFAR